MEIKMPETNTANPVDSLIADTQLHVKRLKGSPLTTVEQINAELCNNLYPMIQATLEQIAEVDEAVLEMVDQQGSYIQEDLAQQIFHTVAVGGALVEEVKKLELDDLTKKKVTDLIAAYEHSAQLTVMAVTNAVSEGDDDDDGDEDDDEDTGPTQPGKKDDEDEEGGEEEKTPVEVPTPAPPADEPPAAS